MVAGKKAARAITTDASEKWDRLSVAKSKRDQPPHEFRYMRLSQIHRQFECGAQKATLLVRTHMVADAMRLVASQQAEAVTPLVATHVKAHAMHLDAQRQVSALRLDAQAKSN